MKKKQTVIAVWHLSRHHCQAEMRRGYEELQREWDDTETIWSHIMKDATADWAVIMENKDYLHEVIVWVFCIACTQTHKRHLMTLTTCYRATQGPRRQTPPPPTAQPSIATSVITQSINSGPCSIWQASTWGEKQSLSTSRYMILTGGEIRLSLFNHAGEIGPVRFRTGANPECLHSYSCKRLQ